MLSKNVMKQLEVRIRIMALFGQTIYNWDPSKGQLVPASVYKRWNWWLTNVGGILFVACHCLRLYMTLTDENQEQLSPGSFATSDENTIHRDGCPTKENNADRRIPRISHFFHNGSIPICSFCRYFPSFGAK
ncbi:unnamed protein product [Orchesella dallaii]|uniref:Uncharacterized protein n=1 Tax=Orchesella dallaii TaxID=48710 RepID=A0ABP1Q7U1_9HEXA